MKKKLLHNITKNNKDEYSEIWCKVLFKPSNSASFYTRNATYYNIVPF